MQNTAVQLETSRGVKTVSKTGKASSAKNKGVDASKADPFLQMIMSLLSQNEPAASGEAADNSAQLTDLLSMVQNLGTADSGESGASTSALMQLLAGSSNTLPALASLENGQDDSSKDLFAELMQLRLLQTQSLLNMSETVDLQSLLQQLPTGAVQNSFGALTAGTQQAQTTAGTQIAASADPQTAALAGSQLPLSESTQKTAVQPQLSTDSAKLSALADPAVLKSVESASADKNAGEDAQLSQQQAFPRSIAKAKELLTEAAKSSDQEKSADKLESGLSASKTASPFELRLQAAAKAENTSVVRQIETGMKENLSAGKSEFTIKLKPESLGEITVKLTEESGKSVLTITTASATTAKLLNSDLDSLKAAMAPLNVRVNEAVTQTAPSQQSGSQSFDMSGQQFAGQQQQQQFARQFTARQSTPYYTASNYAAEDSGIYAFAGAAAPRTLSSGGLDAYI